MRTAIPAHCTQSVMDTRMAATPASRAKTMEASVISGCSTRLFVLRSRRRPLAVHPKFEISSENAQSRPASIKCRKWPGSELPVHTTETGFCAILVEFCQAIPIEVVFQKVRPIRFLTTTVFEKHSQFQKRTTPQRCGPAQPSRHASIIGFSDAACLLACHVPGCCHESAESSQAH